MARRRKMDSGCGGAARRTRCDNSRPASVEVKPVQRNAANARERARMRVLSKAFSRLKTTLPWVPADTKLSKLDTLRLAASYIAHLRHILVDENSAAAEGQLIHPINLTWPFTFNAARAQEEDNQNATTAMETSASYDHREPKQIISSNQHCPFVTQELLDYDDYGPIS